MRSAQAKEKKALRDAQVEAYNKIVADLTAAKEAAEAVLAEAVAAGTRAGRGGGGDGAC